MTGDYYLSFEGDVWEKEKRWKMKRMEKCGGLDVDNGDTLKAIGSDGTTHFSAMFQV